jgi:hypothetical protein
MLPPPHGEEHPVEPVPAPPGLNLEDPSRVSSRRSSTNEPGLEPSIVAEPTPAQSAQPFVPPFPEDSDLTSEESEEESGTDTLSANATASTRRRRTCETYKNP